MDLANGDEDEKFEKLREKDSLCLTNTNKFFPELAWRKVLMKLKKKVDIENCSNASPFLWDLLREIREREVVLPTVFAILAKNYCNDDNKDESFEETNVESTPWKRPAQSEKPHRMIPIWKCRLVCKKWNKAIEEIHQNEDAGHYQMANDFCKASNYQIGRKWGTDRFDEESKVVKFLGLFEATHFSAASQFLKKCPFLGRFVEVTCNWYFESNQQAYANRLMGMFDKFGDQVWYVRFCWWYRKSVLEHAEIYKKMKQIVELMPNLKVLRITYYCSSSKEELRSLQEEIQRNPFPKITNLEMISVDGIPGLLCNHLVNQNRLIIRRLEICNTDFNGNCSIFVDKLPILSQLGLVGVNHIYIFEAFESHPFTLNLDKFFFRCSPMFPVVPWSRIFNAVNSKLNADSCTDLQLRMSWPRLDTERMPILEDIFECRLKLANIQRCQIKWYSCFFFDCSLHPKYTLREVDITPFCDLASKNAEEEELREKQVIKFLGTEENKELSNIVKQLSRLGKLRVCRD